MASMFCGVLDSWMARRRLRYRSRFYYSVDEQNAVMDIYDQPSMGLQDYDVPPANRGPVIPGRRPSHGTVRTSGGASFPGNSFYDTPPSSNRTSGENDNGIYDTPPSSKRASCERTPPHSNRSSASRDSNSGFLSPGQLPNNLPVNHRSGSSLSLNHAELRPHSGSRTSDNCYDTPPGSNRSSLERILTEEGPPIYETLSPASSMERIQQDDSTYDTPPVRNHALSQASPASQSSLRSAASSESLMSSTSGVSSSRLSQTASLPDSARSSMDLPSDTYDVPQAHNDLDRSRKQRSMDSGLGFYDTPVKSGHPSSSSSNVPSSTTYLDANRVPRSPSHDPRSPIAAGVGKDVKRSRSVENALDDLYDTPRSNAPRIGNKKMAGAGSFGSTSALNDSSSGVYDIPPQVTRDSVISNRSDSSDENQRLSSSSMDFDQQIQASAMWDELLLDLDSALELLLKRQQEVSKATSRLTAFVTTSWRTKASLEKTLYDIKVACSLVRNCLGEFVDFAQGAVANACKIPDRQLASRLMKHLSPLQNTSDLVNKSFANLEDVKWQVSLLSEPLDKNRPDDLGQIALVAKDLIFEVKKVASFIQSNGSLLFRKITANDFKRSAVAAKPPIVPKVGDWNGGKIGSGNGYGYAKAQKVQQRPLPAVPGGEKRLPSPKPEQPLGQGLLFGPDNIKRSIYDIKAELHKDDYAECDDIIERQESSSKAVIDDTKHCAQEYDYVQLDETETDNDDTLTRSHTKNKSQTETSGKEIPEINVDDTDSVDSKKVIEPESKEEMPTFDSIDSGLSSINADEKAAVEKLLKEVTGVRIDNNDDDSVDFIPVKESTLERKKAQALKGMDKDLTIDQPAVVPTPPMTEPTHDSLVSDLTEQELKTPVNVTDPSDSQASTFVMPDTGSPISADMAASDANVEEEEEEGELDPNDRQVLVFYSEQMNSHSTLLANAIDAFISVVRANQPPNVFISHSKFVIVSAHRLVHIGDSVHRNLVSNTISGRVIHSANHLCDCLKASVNATKTAALQFPSQVAVQDMVDKVIAVSHAAHQLKVIVTQANRI